MLSEKEEQRAAAQAELDDMLMVFGDVEDKVARYRVSYPVRLGEIDTDSIVATTP